MEHMFLHLPRYSTFLKCLKRVRLPARIMKLIQPALVWTLLFSDGATASSHLLLTSFWLLHIYVINYVKYLCPWHVRFFYDPQFQFCSKKVADYYQCFLACLLLGNSPRCVGIHMTIQGQDRAYLWQSLIIFVKSIPLVTLQERLYSHVFLKWNVLIYYY